MIRQSIARILCFVTILFISNNIFSRAFESTFYSIKHKIETRFYIKDYFSTKSTLSNSAESYFSEENDEDNDDDSHFSYLLHYDWIGEYKFEKNSSKLLKKELFKFARFPKIPRWLLICRIII
jgi:hypothetical protein